MSVVPNFLLRQSQDILEQCVFGVCIANKEGVMIRVNHAFEEICGLKSTHFINRHVAQAVDLGIIDNSSILKLIRQDQRCAAKVKTMAGKELISNAFVVQDENQNPSLFATILRGVEKGGDGHDPLRETVDTSQRRTARIIGSSQEMNKILAMAGRYSCFDCPVLIEGETGVGKGLIAKYIHNSSPRRGKSFITINCGAIPSHLMESELFGYAPGSFTGANHKGKKGLFEEADGGTIFLDEIGELPLELQVKLLRVIEKKAIHKLGALAEKKLDIRIIAATNRNLLEMITERTFRPDLYYRLNVVAISIPPLRDRRVDIPDLLSYYLSRHNNSYGTAKKICTAAEDAFFNYNWPGNVRELSNIIERAVITTHKQTILPDDLPEQIRKNRNISNGGPGPGNPDLTRMKFGTLRQELATHERRILTAALGTYHTQEAAARGLGISLSTLTRKLNKYKIRIHRNYD